MNTSWAKTDERWYLGVKCHKCHLPILFGLDRSDGETQPAVAWKLVLTCTVDNCRHQADYTAAAVSRFQKQAANSNETSRNHENSKGREQKRRS
jgi:hypothetical protein